MTHCQLPCREGTCAFSSSTTTPSRPTCGLFSDSGPLRSGFHAIEVTPPNETHSKVLSTDLNLPVGADGKVFVDPVGTGKQ